MRAAACFLVRMPYPPRDRRLLSVWLSSLIAFGLGSRASGMPGFVVLYAGDVLWGSMFFVLGAWLCPAAPPLRLWGVMTVLVELIEVSQLYQAPWAQALRATRLGGLLLGHVFLWSDVFCVLLGTSVAALVEVLSGRRRSASK